VIADSPDLIAKRAELSPQRMALEEIGTGRTLTYAELDRRAAMAASLLVDRGVGEGDRVAILCRNRIAFFELLFACAKAGAILVPLNWRMPPAELDQLLTDCTPSLLFFGAEDEASVAGIMYPPPSIGLDREYEALLEAALPRSARPLWPASDIWYLLYTSGTTGRPKGVIYTYGMALANYVNIGSAIDLRSTDSTPNFLPIFHTAGINLHSLPTLFAGGRVLVLKEFDAEALVDLLEQRRIDTFFGVPTVFQELVGHPRFAAAPLGQVRHWGCGGAPLPDALVERYRELGVRVCNGMGMTETGPTAFLAAPGDAWDHVGSVGKPQLLCSVRIVDEDERTSLRAKSATCCSPGPRSPRLLAQRRGDPGGVHRRRLAKIGRPGPPRRGGFYYVAGRRKDMFISGGENVYPAEIENVLCSHPAVAQAAVIAAQDDKWARSAALSSSFEKALQSPVPRSSNFLQAAARRLQNP
jgi:fatty-acyl-CoA synthase